MTYSSASLNMQRQAVLSRNKNTVRQNDHQVGLGPISNTILLAVMLCVLGLIYLTQVTKTNAFGYQLNDLKTRKEQLIQDNQSLQVEAAQLQSLDRVKNSSVAANLTSPAATTIVAN